MTQFIIIYIGRNHIKRIFDYYDMYNVKVGNGDRQVVLDYIESKRQSNANFKVVDVGGSVEGWSAKHIDALIDFNAPENNMGILHFNFDITHPDGWKLVHDYVEKNGKFDFCICCHTLEDIMNPGYVCEQLSKIASEGYIAVPSKHSELAIFDAYYLTDSKHRNSGVYYGHRGYMHHRWIFSVYEDMFVGFPKIGYLENMHTFNKFNENKPEIGDLSFFWKDTIGVTYLNKNYLGPTAERVVELYDLLLEDEFL
jgi:hypothetical protein